MKKKIVILDSNAVIHRAYHALPPFTTADGVMVNAVYGYAKLLLKVIKDIKPDIVLAAFDVAGDTFRHNQFEAYKANRVAADQDLYDQIPLVKEMLESIEIPILELAGYEADDIIGTIAKQTSKTSNELIIVTGDMDTMQLVKPQISVYTLRKSINDTVIFDTEAVISKYQIRPDQVCDFKGLKGDPSDNIPGVPGIGDLRAVNLLRRFETIENIYKFIDKYTKFEDIDKEDREALTKSIFENLKNNKEQAFFSRELATIITDAPIGEVVQDSIDYTFPVEKAKQIFKHFEFYSLVKELNTQLEKANNHKSQTSFWGQTNIAPVAKPESVEDEKFHDLSQLTNFPLAIWAEQENYIAIDTNGQRAKLSEKELRVLLASEQNIICADIKPIIRKLYPFELKANLQDVILMVYLINPGERQLSLEAVCGAYGVGYNSAQPELVLHQLYDLILSKMQTLHIEEVYNSIERPLLPVLAKMEAVGVLFDESKLQATKTFVEDKITTLTRDIYAIAGEEFNLNSPKQLADILFNKLNLSAKGVKKTNGGQVSTSAQALESMREEFEIVDLILQYREVAKLKSTYIDSLPTLMDDSGRIHTTYQQNIAATGRLSSVDPNLQNIPARGELGRQIKNCFVAPEGWTLLICDYSQIELRLAAHLSQDQAMLEIFRQNIDFHTATAQRVYGVKTEEVTKEMRSFAKTINFGILYGMGATSLAQNLKIKRAEAQVFLDKYRQAYPELNDYMESLKQFARKHGYAQTEYGRIRDLSNIDIRNPRNQALLDRIAVNMPIQGLQADIIKLAMIQINEYIADKDNIYMILQVHDELVFEVKADKAEQYKDKILEIMESVYKAAIPIKVEAVIKDYWG
ncbi:MAG: polymerase [Candidatus Parcubacteria bacterium]|jgi:DNA polymerase-1